MNSMWSKQKSRLSVEKMRTMLVARQNCVMEWEKFYDKVLKDRNLLHKITCTSLEKYSWYDPGEFSALLRLPKFLYGFCHWRTMESSIKCFLSSYFFMNTEYYITPIPLLPSQCPVLSEGNMVSLAIRDIKLTCIYYDLFLLQTPHL
jgi:hypothetical protein